MRRISGVLAFAIGALLLTGVSGAAAQTYKPNKTSDHAPNGCTSSDCTLREAVIAANDHVGFDKIVLQPGKVYKRSALAGTDEDAALNGDLDITDSLRIETPRFVKTKHGKRPAKRATIDANHNERVIYAAEPLTLTRLVIRNGDTSDAGGGVLAEDPLTVRSTDFIANHSDNYAPGIHFNSASTVDRMLLSHVLLKGNTSDGQGGTVYLNGPGKIIDSVIKNNHATGDSGGVHMHYDTEVIRTTISGNTANYSAGGISNDGGALTIRDSTISGNTVAGGSAEGGGVYMTDDTTITNSTIAGNKAIAQGGGISVSGGLLTLNGVTIVRNVADTDATGDHGGGLYSNGANPAVSNTIIALNTVGGASTNPDCFGANSSGGNNLIGVLTGGCTGFNAIGDLVGGALKLGPLKSNGGPTKTVALLKGSRAINHGGGDAPAKDQRGRKKNGRRDIGAFEYKGKN